MSLFEKNIKLLIYKPEDKDVCIPEPGEHLRLCLNSWGEAFQKALDSLADEDDDRGDLLRGAGDVQGLQQLVESLHVWGGRQAGALLDERLQL